MGRKERDTTNGMPLSDKTCHEWALKSQDFFSKVNALTEDENEDDSLANVGGYSMHDNLAGIGSVQKMSPDEERALCEKFEETLLEYDSDEIGDNPEEEIEGRLPLQGDQQVDAALNDFLQEKKDEVFMQGRLEDQNKGGSGFSALVGTRMVPVKDMDGMDIPDDAAAEPVDVVLTKADKRL